MIETPLRTTDPYTRLLDVTARLIRVAPRLTTALTVLTGFPLKRETREPDEPYALCERDAQLLDTEPGTTAIRRDGYLVSALGGTPFRAAQVTSLVLPDRLGLADAEREAFDLGVVPLGELLATATRVTHFAYRVAGAPLDDRPALQIRGTLLLGGTPVALVEETVLWRAIGHRASTEIPDRAKALLSGRATW